MKLNFYLNKVEALMAAPLDVQEVLKVACEKAIELVDARRGFVFVLTENTDERKVEALHSHNIDDFGDGIFSFSQGIVGEVVETGEWRVTMDAGEDERYADRASVQLGALRSVLCVPLRIKGETVGALYVDDRTRSGVFRDDEVAAMNAFANTAAIMVGYAFLANTTRT